MEVWSRVHVVALAGEIARVVEPTYRLKADKVVVLRPPEARLAEFEREMLADLEDRERLSVDQREVSLSKLERVRDAFESAIDDHPGDDVYVNVSGGGHVAGIAGAMAARRTEATPFLVDHSPEDTEDERQASTEDASGSPESVPVIDIDGPSDEQLEILSYLHGTNGATKKELVAHAERIELPLIANTTVDTRTETYRLLESHIVDPLADAGYVSVVKAGRRVYIDRDGIEALAEFPLGPDPDEATADEDAVVSSDQARWMWESGRDERRNWMWDSGGTTRLHSAPRRHYLE
jgi:hypothetical protein